jgi:hypothetical protein
MEASGGVRIRIILSIFSQAKDLLLINMIIPNHASNPIFFACLAGRPATAGQADDVPIAIGRSNLNSRVYQTISRLCSFTGTFADIHNY